ncbi:MAG TPA: universal stress protein [Planctomycetota bacterium]|jgi:nucleotide-binding universal stress UspA family protein
MIDFKNIVLTTDLSDNAAAAAPYAMEMARRFGGTIHLVSIFDDSLFYASPAAADGTAIDPAEWMSISFQERERTLATLAESLAKEAGVPVKLVLRRGHAATEIVNVAKDVNADCVIIATHGRTGLAHFLFGSVVERIVRFCPCPVLSIRPQAMRTDKPVPSK